MFQPIYRASYLFRVVKRINNSQHQPVPNMEAYYLESHTGQPLSFWNDIPLNLNERSRTSNCCIEIPKESRAKIQMEKKVVYHPLIQDTHKNRYTKQMELRDYAQFPLFNYGFIPQTWEQNIVPSKEGLLGDDDPIDVCELSQVKKNIGDIFQSKILGSFCLIDQGEIDFKVFMLDTNEARKRQIHDLKDIDSRLIASILRWFKYIKTFDGKKENTIAFEEKIFSIDETVTIVKETHDEWVKLRSSGQAIYSNVQQKYFLK